jgi:hypothetical protein
MFIPAIATSFPEQLRKEQSAIQTEEVDDSMNRLEEDPLKAQERELEQNREEEPAQKK